MNIVSEALAFATDIYKTSQKTGTKVPYLTHPLNVCSLLAERHCRDEILAAALLHDAVENTGVGIGKIENMFGCDVAEMVEGTTGPYISWDIGFDNKYKYYDGKEHLADFIIADATYDQLLLILADNLDNLKTIKYESKRYGENFWNNTTHGKLGEQYYYSSLMSAFRTRKFHPLDAYNDLKIEFEKTVSELF